MIRWHVASVWAGTEPRAIERLIAAGGVEIAWPRWVERIRSYGRDRIAVRSMAAGYLFIRFDGDDPVEWHRVRDAGELTFIGGWPVAPVPTREMLALIERFVDPVARYGKLGRDPGAVELTPGVLEPFEEERVEGVVEPGDRIKLLGALESCALATVTWVDRRGFRATTAMFGRQMEMYLRHVDVGPGRLAEAIGTPRKRGSDVRAPQYGRGARRVEAA